MAHEFDYMSASELRLRIGRKDISPVELTRRSLERAEAVQADLNPFFVLFHDEALAAAQVAEDALMSGAALGALHGLPMSVKDLIAVGDAPFAFGSKVMADNIADADAPAVERARAAGAIVIGKTTTSEFGCKPVGDSPLTGITRNPWNRDKTPGGSSAGAGASIAAGVTPFGLGTDGGGSIRIPCSLTGLAGIKGSFARVPVWPTTATPTLAHVGPMARNMRDAALLFSAIAGYDARDPGCVSHAVPDYTAQLHGGLRNRRIGVARDFFFEECDPEVAGAVEAALGTIREGVTSGEVDAAANAALEKRGIRQWHYHRTGYMVGVASIATWGLGHIGALREADPLVLKENMTFHLPMVLFRPGAVGAGLSETVRVIKDGVEVLTGYPTRELIAL